MLTQHAPDLWTESAPHTMLGVHFGARMTVVRLPDGGLWLHSPLPLTDARRAELAAFGPVRHIVAPNLFHHLYAGEWAAAVPDAQLHLAPGLDKKRPDLKGTSLDGANPWPGTLDATRVDGFRMMETTFFHAPSRTLICTDLVANLPPSDHAWTRFYSWMTGLKDEPSVNRIIRGSVNDNAAARRSLDALIALDPARLILAHGRILETEGAAGLRQAWSWLP